MIIKVDSLSEQPSQKQWHWLCTNCWAHSEGFDNKQEAKTANEEHDTICPRGVRVATLQKAVMEIFARDKTAPDYAAIVNEFPTLFQPADKWIVLGKRYYPVFSELGKAVFYGLYNQGKLACEMELTPDTLQIYCPPSVKTKGCLANGLIKVTSDET